MFRSIFIIILFQYMCTLIFPTSQNDDAATCFDCACDLEIDAVRKFTEDLGNVQKRVNEIAIRISRIQIHTNKYNNLKPSSCMEAAAGSLKSGRYSIQLEKFDAKPISVWCNEDIDYGGWLVIQRRESDSVDFYRGWEDYKNGFGFVNGNYWIGLEKLHILTTSCEQELYIEMKEYNGKSYYAKYSEFVIGSESEGYVLKKLGTYEGNAGDSLTPHLGQKFTTYDRDNDEPESNCAKLYKGAWWFTSCFSSHLNGLYAKEGDFGLVVRWATLSTGALKFAQMMIRPTENCLQNDWKPK